VKKIGLLLFPMLAITLMLGGNAWATVCDGDNDCAAEQAYFVTYYSNGNAPSGSGGAGAPQGPVPPDGILRIINDGDISSSETEGVPNGNLWADIYVFDDSQEIQECCSCFVSPDGLLSKSVNKQLTANELTGRAETSRGAIKILSSASDDPTNAVLAPGLRGWMTHIQATSTNLTTSKGASPYFVTETALANSNLSVAELDALEQLCSFAITLGSGYGTCSCTLEDHDF